MARLILFDKRGTGLSDPVPVSQLPTLEQRMDDVRAVMEAADSKRAVLLGISEGGPLCMMFAATYPEKTEALIAIGSYARRLKSTATTRGARRAKRARASAPLSSRVGRPGRHRRTCAQQAGDSEFRDWWAAYLRMGASPGAAVALTG